MIMSIGQDDDHHDDHQKKSPQAKEQKSDNWNWQRNEFSQGEGFTCSLLLLLLLSFEWLR